MWARSMSKVIAAVLLGPDEADLWDICRPKAEEWADDIVVLHDEKGEAWGNELPFRQQLWDMAMEACRSQDWIFILDSDFILTFDPHELTELYSPTWRLDLYDLWSPTHYRSDDWWYAHTMPRHWMLRAGNAPMGPQWDRPNKYIHTGHIPTNYPTRVGIAPSRMAILHLGWYTPEIRQRKYDRYKREGIWDKLSGFQRKHVETVLDEEPNLEELPDNFKSCLKES